MVSVRITCFIETVSPARNRVRSKMVVARVVADLSMSVGKLKRQDSMPSFHEVSAKAMSWRPFSSVLRALTKRPLILSAFSAL